jgi:predicted MPP superfamily phosphohydrolase
VPVPGTWPALDILHLSDLHLQRGDPRLVRAQIQALTSLDAQPDLVCVTGDLCERLVDVDLVLDVLGRLRPRLGTFAVLGNHEYAARPPRKLRRGFGGLLWHLFKLLFPRVQSLGAEEAAAIAQALHAAGVTVLRNEGVRLPIDGRGLWLAGSDSVWAGRSDLPAALRGRVAHEGVLLLVHEPEAALPAIEHGADLVLAGHTHGGQVRLPVIGPLYTHRTDERLRTAAGLLRIGGAHVHISAGLGQLLPVRINCPPEYVWLHCDPITSA